MIGWLDGLKLRLYYAISAALSSGRWTAPAVFGSSGAAVAGATRTMPERPQQAPGLPVLDAHSEFPSTSAGGRGGPSTPERGSERCPRAATRWAVSRSRNSLQGSGPSARSKQPPCVR